MEHNCSAEVLLFDGHEWVMRNEKEWRKAIRTIRYMDFDTTCDRLLRGNVGRHGRGGWPGGASTGI